MKQTQSVAKRAAKAKVVKAASGVPMHPSIQTLAKDAAFATVTNAKPTTTVGCEDCIAAAKKDGKTHDWVHLNLCRVCGHVGCCDNSPSQHATAHYHSTDHAIMQRFEPGENWGYDYKTGDTFQPFPKEIASPFRHISEEKGYKYYAGPMPVDGAEDMGW